MTIIAKMKKPLLALALMSGMGMGLGAPEALAYDDCNPCVRRVVVKRVKPRRVRCNPCDAPVRRVYRVVEEPVVYVERPAVYYEAAPVYREALPPPPPCSSCR